MYLLPFKSAGSGGKLVKLTPDDTHHKRRLKVNFKAEKTLDNAAKFWIKVNPHVSLVSSLLPAGQ